MSAAVVYFLFSLLSLEGADVPEVHKPMFTVHSGVVDVSAEAFYVFDIETGIEFISYNENTPRSIASITKLPAAAAWLLVAPMQGSTTIRWSDVNAEGRAGKLSHQDEYRNHDLVFPLLLESSNDAAAAMERVTENQIIAQMNTFASSLGLSDTKFVDASGLSAENLSTAKELGELSVHLKTIQPHVFDVSTLSQYIHEDNGWVNNNPFIEQAGYRGGKHGFTYEANRTIVAIFEESFLGGTREVGYVILGSEDLTKDINMLRQFVQASVSYE